MTDERGSRRQSAALYFVCLGVLMVVLDTTIVTVALPSIVIDLGVSKASLSWIVNAYTLSFGCFLLLAGRLGDLYGARRLFLLGIVVFTFASLGCGLARTELELLLARAIQGVGAAVIYAVALSLIADLFPAPARRTWAVGIYGAVCAAGGGVGELLGGIVTQTLGWNWTFLINVPLGLATYILCNALLPVDVRRAERQRPVLPWALFRSRTFIAANVVGALWAAGMLIWFVTTALYLQRVLVYDPLRVGLSFLPAEIVMGAFSAGVSARVIMRFGAGVPLCLALLLSSAGLGLFSRAPVDGVFVFDVLPPMLLLGVGTGLASSAVFIVGMSGTAAENSGVASGTINTSIMVGGALGLTVATGLAAMRTRQFGLTEAVAAALNGGYHWAFMLGALITGSAALVGALMGRDHLERTSALQHS